MSEAKPRDFSKAAATWDADPRRTALARAVAEAIARETPLDGAMQALEFGCGTGLVGLQLAPRFAHLTAVDNAPGMLAALEEKARAAGLANVTAWLSPAGPPSLPESPYDLVFSCMVLHHVPGTAELLSLFFRGLRPGAILALADLDAEDGSFHDNPAGIAHHGFDRNQLRELAEAAGFEAVRFVTACRITKKREQGPRGYPVFLLLARRPA
ncbi:MAG: class I SAM-dependent methyltransferase [Desulfuromonas sp.]|uniref:class I SAM-dependent DNA methyltransferase n=1 Tax=Desulfuromonas sp. TaxID=892 RepID=UPI000CA6DD9B|nr:class I SAM-dependent methyltransferase [Desulfuromonas sp.]PLX83491.1 MAG: class I SAM-dependent methyltransferase [Desulfuromonas sp.]